jgi:hypothetical protein
MTSECRQGRIVWRSVPLHSFYYNWLLTKFHFASGSTLANQVRQDLKYQPPKKYRPSYSNGCHLEASPKRPHPSRKSIFGADSENGEAGYADQIKEYGQNQFSTPKKAKP